MTTASGKSWKMFKNILIAIYHHPEAYPPTLSAIDQLSECCSQVDVVCRNSLKSLWKYPGNVELHYTTRKQYEGFGIENITLPGKVWHFVRFTLKIRSLLKKNKPDVLLVYDVIPLWSAYLLRNQIRRNKTQLWYHNHDTTDVSKAGKYSVTGLAARFEKRSFRVIDFFSLPARERLVHFPVTENQENVFVIPNYPLKKFYGNAFLLPEEKEPGKLKMVFQGSIGPGHGLEEIIPLLDRKIHGKQPELHLVGKVRPAYLEKIRDLVQQNGVSNHFFYHGLLPFTEMPRFLSQFHIGLAIHKPYNVTYSTGGSASNKIYEYAACGLPVVLYDLPHYHEYLDQSPWAFFTDLTESSFLHALSEISGNLKELSRAAGRSFEEEKNFENAFRKVKEYVSSNVTSLWSDLSPQGT